MTSRVSYLEHVSFFELIDVGVSLFHFVKIHSGTMKQPKYNCLSLIRWQYFGMGRRLTLILMYD